MSPAKRYIVAPQGGGPPLLITTNSPLVSGEVGLAYSQTLQGSGGAPPYFWSLVSGFFPTGLGLSVGGVVSGTPSATGSSTVTLQIMDSRGARSPMKSFGITVVAAVTITTGATLPTATQGVAYTQTLAATGGVTPYTWSLLSQTGSNTWSVSTSGNVTGTPSVSETDTLDIQVIDALGGISTRIFSLTVQNSLHITTTSPLSGATQGSAYSFTMAAAGGTSPYTWSLTSQTGSNGWALSSAGVITGTPANLETDSLVIKVTDSASATFSGTFTITTSAVPTGVYQGGNFGGVGSTEQPYLNLLNSGQGFANFTGWSTNGSTTYPQLYAVLDANGYPTSLPGGNAITTFLDASLNDQDPLGTTGSGIGNGPPPGAATVYPGGSYTIQFQGACTFTFSRDVTSGTLATSSTNVSVSGLTVTSTMTSGQSGVVTFNVNSPGTAGIQLNITALPSPTNYFRNASVVRTSQVANYNAGARFDPNWIASVTNNGAGGYKRLRFMDDLVMAGSYNNTCFGNIYLMQVPALTTGSSLTQTMTTVWNAPSRTYSCVLGRNNGSDLGQNNTVTLTYQSATAVFGSAFTGPVTAGATNLWIQAFEGWSTRNVPTNVFWGNANGNGTPGMIPYETAIAMCNATNTDCWLNVPLWVNSFTGKQAFWTSLAQLVQSNLNPGLKCYLEIGNEIFIEADEPYCNMLAFTMFGVGDFTSFLGLQYALMSQAFQAVFGSSFASTIMVGPTTQFATGNGVSFIEGQMNGGSINGGVYPNSFLAAKPYTYFTHYSFAPYFIGGSSSQATITSGNASLATPNSFQSGTQVSFVETIGNIIGFTTYFVLATGLSSTHFEISATLGGTAITPTANGVSTVSASFFNDLIAMMAVTTPLDDFFACMYGNVGTTANGGVVYPSVPANGWVGGCLSTISAIKSAVASQPWASLPVHGYESGPGLSTAGFSSTAGSYAGPYGGGTYTTQRSATTAFCINANRDVRMGYTLYDPTHLLTYNGTPVGQPGFLPAAITAGMTTMNYFDDCLSESAFGPWGALSNVMQLPSSGGSGTAASYPKYAAIMDYIEGIVPITFQYYISPTGDDSNVGSLASPWSITALQSKWTTYSGKSVGLLPGTYTYGQVGGVQTTLYSLCMALGNTTNQMAIAINGGPSGSTLTAGSFVVGNTYTIVSLGTTNFMSIGAGENKVGRTFIANGMGSGTGTAKSITQTLIQSTTPRGAVFNASNPSGGAPPTNECPLFGQGLYNSTVPNPGNIIIDGICVEKTYQTGMSFFSNSSTEGTGWTGIEIRNCEIAHIAGTDNDNVAGLYMQGLLGCWVHNNVIHDIQGSASNPDDVGGLFSYYCQSNLYEYNTIYDCNNAIYEKFFPNGNHTWRYNYFESNGSFPQNAVHGGSGGTSAGDTQSVYNNIILAPQTELWDASLGGGTCTQSLVLYNNTFVLDGANTGGNYPSGITYPLISTGKITQYNNVFSNVSPSTIQYDGIWCYPIPASNVALSDYNIVTALAATSGVLASSTTGSPESGTLHTLAAWQSTYSLDAHSVAQNPSFVSPTYVSSSYNTAGWKLTAGSIGSASGSNPGKVGGISTGASIDMGAWGGTDVNTGNAISQIGATWTATLGTP